MSFPIDFHSKCITKNVCFQIFLVLVPCQILVFHMLLFFNQGLADKVWWFQSRFNQQKQKYFSHAAQWLN